MHTRMSNVPPDSSLSLHDALLQIFWAGIIPLAVFAAIVMAMTWCTRHQGDEGATEYQPYGEAESFTEAAELPRRHITHPRAGMPPHGHPAGPVPHPPVRPPVRPRACARGGYADVWRHTR